MFELNDIKGLLQSKQFYDSVNLSGLGEAVGRAGGEAGKNFTNC